MKGTVVQMKSLANYINANGGMTYNLKSNKMLTSGYMVGNGKNEMIIKGKVNERNIMEYIQEYRNDLLKDNHNFGAWYNEADGHTYLDTSISFNDYNEAVLFAKANDEIAIFDLSTLTEIRLK